MLIMSVVSVLSVNTTLIIVTNYKNVLNNYSRYSTLIETRSIQITLTYKKIEKNNRVHEKKKMMASQESPPYIPSPPHTHVRKKKSVKILNSP